MYIGKFKLFKTVLYARQPLFYVLETTIVL